jgi:hypothetical protein
MVFSDHWVHTSEQFDREVAAYNLRDISLKREVVSSFEFLTAKITECLPAIDRVSAESPTIRDADLQTVFYRKNKNEFGDYYIDYLIYKLKNVRKTIQDSTPLPLRLLSDLERVCKAEETGLAVEVGLLCFRQNERLVTERKIFRLSVQLGEPAVSLATFSYFSQFLCLIFMQRSEPFELNSRACELVEKWTARHLSMVTEMDAKVVFGLLFGLYGMFVGQIKSKAAGFSPKFFKALSMTVLFHEVPFWEKAVAFLVEVLKKKERIFYPYFLGSVDKPRRLKEPIGIVELVLNLCVVFLRMPLEKTLDILVAVNEKKEFVSIDFIQKASFDFEAKWIDVQKTRYTSVSERVMTMAKVPFPLLVVLKLTLPFLGFGKPLLSVLFLNRKTATRLKSAIFKQLLFLDSLNDERRIRIWLELAAIHSPDCDDPLTASKIRQGDPKLVSIIKMDVKRTNFAKFYAPQLEEMLVDLALRFPEVNYYQGMNCIGGYLLNYLDDPAKARRVFCLLITTRLTQYFGNNFEQLKKLIYVGERILRQFLPRLCEHLEKLGIGNVLYISPFILTIFTSFLQFYQNYALINRITDLFVALGWLGFFKVMIYVFGQVEERLLGKSYDTVLLFLNKKVYEFMFQMKLEGLKAAALGVPITKGMVHQFGIDFDKSRRVIEGYWMGYYERLRKAEREAERASPQGSLIKSLGEGKCEL